MSFMILLSDCAYHLGMFIPDPGSWFLPIPDPGSKNSNKRERWKKISCHTFLCSHKFHKIVNYFSFEVLKKKIWVNFQRIIELFTQKIVKKLLKIWSWDPGSGKNLFRIPDPGSRGQKAPNPGSRIRIRNTGPGFAPSIRGTVKPEGRQMKQCWIFNIVREKIKKSPKKIF